MHHKPIFYSFDQPDHHAGGEDHQYIFAPTEALQTGHKTSIEFIRTHADACGQQAVRQPTIYLSHAGGLHGHPDKNCRR